MMFTALATPATANTVTSSAGTANDTSQSTPGMSVRVMTASRTQAASMADTAVKKSRRRGLWVLVRSSARPPKKAGAAQPSSLAPRTVSPPLNANRVPSELATPTTMPSPPMRGTGVAWNFCGPLMSASADRWEWVLAERITKKVTVADRAKARNSTTIGQVYSAPPRGFEPRNPAAYNAARSPNEHRVGYGDLTACC